jgi:four helix bundle protein
MKESVAYNKAFLLAVKLVKYCIRLQDEKREFVLSKQLLRCGTSIGANLAEANGAISMPDFSNKVSIAYKESLETKYWLELLKESDFIDELTFTIFYSETDEISKILFAILKTTRIKQ